MNWLDIVIIILLVVPTLLGLKNGIIKAAFTVAGVIIGVVLAGRFSDSLGSVFTDAAWGKVLAYAIILAVVLIIASIAARLVKNVLQAVLLNWINRLGGAILGLFLGIFFCGGILSMWVHFLDPGETVANSFMARLLLDYFPVVLGLLPSEFDAVKDFFN